MLTVADEANLIRVFKLAMMGYSFAICKTLIFFAVEAVSGFKVIFFESALI